jgi:hypothetical protein
VTNTSMLQNGTLPCLPYSLIGHIACAAFFNGVCVGPETFRIIGHYGDLRLLLRLPLPLLMVSRRRRSRILGSFFRRRGYNLSFQPLSVQMATSAEVCERLPTVHMLTVPSWGHALFEFSPVSPSFCSPCEKGSTAIQFILQVSYEKQLILG